MKTNTLFLGSRAATALVGLGYVVEKCGKEEHDGAFKITSPAALKKLSQGLPDTLGIGRKTRYEISKKMFALGLTDSEFALLNRVAEKTPDVPPPPVVRRGDSEIWDRYDEALRLRKEGKTFKQIGESLSVTASWARAMCFKAERGAPVKEKKSLLVYASMENPQQLLQFNGFGKTKLRDLAQELHKAGLIASIEEWLGRGIKRATCPHCGKPL